MTKKTKQHSDRTTCNTLLVKLFSAPYSRRLTTTCLSCTCFLADSRNSNKSHHIFVCAQYPVFGHGKGRGPAEISFTNRWELEGPLAWEARFSRFSQDCCRIYWFYGEKKITILTSSLQFLGACWKKPSYLCDNALPRTFSHSRDLCGLRVERW